MFIPMNVEGGTWNEHFITTPKLVCIIGIVVSIVLIYMYLSSASVRAGWFAYVFYTAIWAIVSSLVLRFIVFEEKFYYQMYKKLETNEITTPALFWNIVTINDTQDGALLTYSDAKIAVVVKLDRDTITGKSDDFQEEHYDAISDFYRAVAEAGYSFVQMNLMETAGKDPRLNELAKLMRKSKNERINKLMELQIGHTKNMTNRSLYESDYFLFYTRDIQKIDTIIDEIQECLFKLRDGAYTGWTVLSKNEIIDLVKELYGVNYFNSTDASLRMFANSEEFMMRPFNVSGIVWSDGNKQMLTQPEVTRLRMITNKLLDGTMSMSKLSLKDTFYKKDKSNKIGIDLDKILGDTNEDEESIVDFGGSADNGDTEDSDDSAFVDF